MNLRAFFDFLCGLHAKFVLSCDVLSSPDRLDCTVRLGVNPVSGKDCVLRVPFAGDIQRSSCLAMLFGSCELNSGYGYDSYEFESADDVCGFVQYGLMFLPDSL